MISFNGFALLVMVGTMLVACSIAYLAGRFSR
jgi:hypothetical protein